MRTSDHPPLLAFHSYPQLITVFFNRRVFGPPLCVTTTSSWPWIDRRVSGLLPATIRPLTTRFPYGSPIRLALLLRSKSPTPSPKGTPYPLRATITCKQPVSDS